ncbi:MAG: class I SAM-dependent methyltransferase [Syntrophobacteraceae bacterium]
MKKSRCPSDPPLSFPQAEAAARLGRILQDTGYSGPQILQALGINDFRALRLIPPPVLAARVEGDRPLDLFIRLFLLEEPVKRNELKRAIPASVAKELLSSGLIRASGDSLRASLKLRPHKDSILAHDAADRLLSANRDSFVMGVGESSLTLLNATIRRRSRKTLDLGTGCGIQAVEAAAHSERVLALDVNPRAVRFAAFNAALNGLANVETVEGSLFHPVEGNLFDLIVSNPPFVISPEKGYIYRDAGMDADRVCETIVRQAPNHLYEGGYCQILCNWVERFGEDWKERLASWCAGSGCDVLVMLLERQDAEAYAALWIGHTEKAEAERFGTKYGEWLRYYRERGIRSIGSGLITMRRSSGSRNWFRANDTPAVVRGPRCGRVIQQTFKAIDFLEATADDRTVFGLPFLVSQEVRIRQDLQHSPRGWKSVAQVLFMDGGIAVSERISPFTVEFLAGCDGRRTLREAFAKAACDAGIDPAIIPLPFRREVRRLIECGYLALPSA